MDKTKQNNTSIYSLQEAHFRSKDTHRLKVKDGKRYSMQMEMEQKADVVISDKIDFKIETVIEDIEGHYIMVKGSIQQNIILINKYIYVYPTYVHQNI